MKHRKKQQQRPSVVEGQLRFIIELLKVVLRKEYQMSAQLDTLEAQVRANTEVEASAVILIRGLADQIAAAGTDPAKLATLTTSLKSSADDLAAAVAANTAVA
jgi:hypothetical protein